MNWKQRTACGALLTYLAVAACGGAVTSADTDDGGSAASPKASGSAPSPSPSPQPQPGQPPTGKAPLFVRMGGEPGIIKLVEAVLAAELADAEIGSYFALNTKPTPGHPSLPQIRECMVRQLVTALAGPGSTYPALVSGGFFCRDMTTAHANLHIGGATFDRYTAIATTAVVAAGFTDPDVLPAFAGFLTANRSLIADPLRIDAGGFFDAGPADATPDGP
ncbi:MAG: hypothetical protein IPG50_30025 [Myxococcales bacterium]|nr:hypothetical protein [Myxococcales bacterium]